ncbi:hypothetical protein [Sphingopyxis sp.]|uniref:hypothetical protein n=1 Tax=Sphingopyxis sp. TaxID=1908224 RepID=UPI002FCAA0CB
MIWNLVSVAAIALAGFADPQGQAQPAHLPPAAPDRISYTGSGNGWTGGRTEWWIDHSGRGGYRTTVGRKASGTFDAGPQGFARVRAILRPLEDVRELPCDGAVTDQGMGALSWRLGVHQISLRFDFGCNFRRPDAARDMLNEADKLVRQWSAAK